LTYFATRLVRWNATDRTILRVYTLKKYDRPRNNKANPLRWLGLWLYCNRKRIVSGATL
jgi:hypothetical protein